MDSLGIRLVSAIVGERLYPQSMHELRQLVKLHGAEAVIKAVRLIDREFGPPTDTRNDREVA